MDQSTNTDTAKPKGVRPVWLKILLFVSVKLMQQCSCQKTAFNFFLQTRGIDDVMQFSK